MKRGHPSGFPGQDLHRMSVRLPAEIWERCRRIAKARGVTVARLIGDLILSVEEVR